MLECNDLSDKHVSVSRNLFQVCDTMESDTQNDQQMNQGGHFLQDIVKGRVKHRRTQPENNKGDTRCKVKNRNR